MKDRVILHCDCNNFFASVETVLNPEYKNVPLAVCGSQDDRHGIVLAKNELAKKYNIKTAETVFSAKKKCPGLVICSPHYEKYAEYSERANAIYYKYTDMVEQFGIDESWLDVTASKKLFGTGYEIAEKIRKEIRDTLGITVSIGVSFNKVFAKLGSDYKKPDAITVIDRENFKKIIFPLPVSDLLFVGPKTKAALSAMGIKTIGDLANSDSDLLTQRLGKNGAMIHKYANGNDNSPVATEKEDAKSISNGFTFKHDLVGREEARIGIDYLSEEIGAKLRRQGLRCGVVALTVKDEFLNSIRRQVQINPPTDISREIADSAFSLLFENWRETKPIRMLTVSAMDLSSYGAEQINLFDTEEDDRREKNKKIDNAVDKIRQKYGIESITNGSIINTDIGIYNAKKEKTAGTKSRKKGATEK